MHIGARDPHRHNSLFFLWREQEEREYGRGCAALSVFKVEIYEVLNIASVRYKCRVSAISPISTEHFSTSGAAPRHAMEEHRSKNRARRFHPSNELPRSFCLPTQPPLRHPLLRRPPCPFTPCPFHRIYLALPMVAFGINLLEERAFSTAHLSGPELPFRV